jgi:hypothetical protein
MISGRNAFLALVFAALSITGCSAHSTTLSRNGSGTGQVIYRVSEEMAFTTVLDAYAALLPKKSVDDIVEGHRRGYNADERTWAGDWWHHRILVIPAIGNDANGNEVHGYWYDYSGVARLSRPPSGQRGLSSASARGSTRPGQPLWSPTFETGSTRRMDGPTSV